MVPPGAVVAKVISYPEGNWFFLIFGPVIVYWKVKSMLKFRSLLFIRGFLISFTSSYLYAEPSLFHFVRLSFTSLCQYFLDLLAVSLFVSLSILYLIIYFCESQHSNILSALSSLPFIFLWSLICGFVYMRMLKHPCCI